MHHVAIMKKSWGLIPKILSGEKTIESRWYQTKRAPWNNIHTDDTVFFKNSGEPITARANVQSVIFLSDLTRRKVKQILGSYGDADGIGKNETANFFKLFKDKKYCILIFLKNPKEIPPFQIYKTGFGAPAAWLTVKHINHIKKI